MVLPDSVVNLSCSILSAQPDGLEQPWTGCYWARFVRAGRVRSADNRPAGLSIEPAALQQAVEGGLFENRAVFIDHSTRRPSLGRLAGVTTAARWNAAEQAVEGLVRLYDTLPGRQAAALLDRLLADQQHAPDVGLSLVFYPIWDGESIVGVRHVESVDLVFQPAADGRVLSKGEQVLTAGRAPAQPDGVIQFEEMCMSETTLQASTPASETPASSGGVTQPAPAAPVAQTLPAGMAASLLAQTNLPGPSRERLGAGAYGTVDDLMRAIEAERGYLAALSADQVIHIGGAAPRAGHVGGMRTGLDRVQVALEAMMSGQRPADAAPLTGIRELYHLLSGDYEMSGVFQPERVQFANVTCATMASMVANALNKVIVNEFQQYPRWWEQIATQQDFASMQAIRWITLGGVGELPTVAEGAAYTELTWDDSYETASFAKKGGYLGITMEAIDKDDTGRLLAAPRALAQAAWLTLSKAVSGVFTANAGVGPNMVDGKALFHTDHGNLGSDALSTASFAAVRTAMRKQTELNSNERLGALTAPKFLLVPPDLEITALQVLGSEVDYGYTGLVSGGLPDNVLAEGGDMAVRMAAAKKRVVVVDLWTDTNDWAAVADPKLFPTVGIGYRYGRQPEVFSVASPTAGLMFTNDTLPIKVRFVFATGPMDYRGMYKANVA